MEVGEVLKRQKEGRRRLRDEENGCKEEENSKLWIDLRFWELGKELEEGENDEGEEELFVGKIHGSGF